MTDLSNAELLALVVDGETEAWGQLVHRFAVPVWRVTANYGLDQTLREDVVQTTWLRLFDKAGSIAHPERLGGWLCRVARNECVDVIRRRNRHSGLADEWDEPDQHDGFDELDLDGDRNRVILRAAWSGLSLSCRELLTLCLQDPPLSYQEIADAIGMPRGSVGPTRSRCLDQLRRSSGIARLLVEQKGIDGA